MQQIRPEQRQTNPAQALMDAVKSSPSEALQLARLVDRRYVGFCDPPKILSQPKAKTAGDRASAAAHLASHGVAAGARELQCWFKTHWVPLERLESRLERSYGDDECFQPDAKRESSHGTPNLAPPLAAVKFAHRGSRRLHQLCVLGPTGYGFANLKHGTRIRRVVKYRWRD